MIPRWGEEPILGIRNFLVRLAVQGGIGILYLLMFLVFSLIMDIITIVSLLMSLIKLVLFRPQPMKDFMDALELTSDNDIRDWSVRVCMVGWIIVAVWGIHALRLATLYPALHQ
jgi:hypothetical protein